MVVEHDYAEIELMYNRFTEPAVRKSLLELKEKLPENPRILDAGCGPGSHFELFDEIFDEAEVTAVDISEPHLERAREKSKGLDASIELVQADLTEEFNLDKSYDLVWFGDVICPSDIENPVKLLKDTVSLLDDEGILAVFYGNWLRQMFMPGYAVLEHKINAAYELMHETKNLKRSWQGPDHPENASKWLMEAGLKDVEELFKTVSYTDKDNQRLEYVEHVLTNDYKDAVEQKGTQAGIAPEEKEKFGKISDPENIMYLLNKDGYYCQMTCFTAFGSKERQTT